MRTLNNFAGHRNHFADVLKNAGSGTLANHLFYRAAVVDIQKLRVGAFDILDGLPHRLYFASKNLNPHGSFFIIDVQLLQAFVGIADQAVDGNKFGIDQISPLLLADHTKWRIAHILHRSEQ